MAKLVDALPSGGSVRKDVQVRILFWAQKDSILFGSFLFYSNQLALVRRESAFRKLHPLFLLVLQIKKRQICQPALQLLQVTSFYNYYCVAAYPEVIILETVSSFYPALQPGSLLPFKQLSLPAFPPGLSPDLG